MVQTRERLRPDWMEDPFAHDPARGERIPLWQLMRTVGIDGLPSMWWTEPADFHGSIYAVSLSPGMDRPCEVVRLQHRGDGAGWTVKDATPVMWASNWHELREARGGRLIPHDRGAVPKTMRVFPAGVVWRIERDGGDTWEVSLPGGPGRYAVDRRHLRYCDRPPVDLDQALQARWVFGPKDPMAEDDGHPLSPSAAEALLQYGRRRRPLIARMDGGRIFTVEPSGCGRKNWPVLSP